MKDASALTKLFSFIAQGLVRQMDSDAFLRETLSLICPAFGAKAVLLHTGNDVYYEGPQDLIETFRNRQGNNQVITVPLTANAMLTLCIDEDNMPDQNAISALAAQLGVAIENAPIAKANRARVDQIELINEISSMLNSSLSIGTIFRIMVTEIKRLLSFDRASLLLYDEAQDSLLIFALETDMRTELPKGKVAPVEGTSAGWVARHNKPLINHDLATRCDFPMDKKLLADGIRSTISMPLFKDRMLGVFNLDSATPRNYTEQDLHVLQPVSRQIAIALENALLFEEVSREKKEWKKTFDAIMDMVWIEDLEGRVIRANHALLARTGLSGAQVSGMPCLKLMSSIGLSTVDHLCDCNSSESSSNAIREVRGLLGNIYNSWSYPVLDDDGRPYATVYYLKDVTMQRHLEQELIRRDRLASLGILGAGIAHEINNPLGIIAGYAEALLDRAREESLQGVEGFEDFPEYLETIHKEIFRCKEILSTLLEFSSPNTVKARELNLNELLKEVMLLVNHRVKRLKCDLRLDLNPDMGIVMGDPGSLRQMLLNIIINALYFTSEGGTIRISSGCYLNHRQETDMSFISIADTGCGIAPELMDRIFDPFFTTKSAGEGTGLGLSICHKIAEDHGGWIEVQSTEGKGSTFTVWLPIKRRGASG